MPKSRKSSTKSAKKSAQKSRHLKKSLKKSSRPPTSRDSDLVRTLDIELAGSSGRNSAADEGEASQPSPPLSPTGESAANSSGSDHSQLHSPSSSHQNGEADQSRESPRSDVEFLGHTAASGVNATDLQRKSEDVAENTATEPNPSSVCVKSPLPSRASPQPHQDSVAPETIQFTDALLQPSNIKTPTPLPTQGEGKVLPKQQNKLQAQTLPGVNITPDTADATDATAKSEEANAIATASAAATTAANARSEQASATATAGAAATAAANANAPILAANANSGAAAYNVTDFSSVTATISGLVTTVNRLQAQIEQQSRTLIDEARKAAVQGQLHEIAMQRQEINESSLQHEVHRLQDELAEKQRDDVHFAKLDEPEYTSRLESLLKTGYKMTDAHAALIATRVDGKYSVTRADAYLKSMAMAARQKMVETANLASPDQPILQDSALGRLLGTPEAADAIDIIVKCKDAHARQRTKAAHSSNVALSASNLLEMTCIKGDLLMGRKGLPFLTQVASAVVEDCSKCSEQRKQAAVSETWKAQASAASKKTEGDATDRSKKRITLPFKTADSHRDVKKPRRQCGDCKKGWEGGKWLYFCDDCNNGFHALCVDWKHLRHPDGGPTWFACHHCVSNRDTAVSMGHLHRQYVLVDEDIEHGRAPQCAEAAILDDLTGGGVEHAKTPSIAPQRAPFTPQGTAAAAAATTPARALPPHYPHTPSGGGAVDFEPNFGSRMDAKPSITVKDYFMWEAVPNDWTPKADSKLKQHPERGYSKTAYQNWRRKNVSLRDSIKAQGSSLGPLVRGISADMKSAIAKQFLKEPLLSGLRPSSTMTDAEIDAWVLSDPESKWFDKIQDDQLLSLLDKRFGVKKPDLFLSKKFYDNLPPLDDHGDVSYHADVFNRWAVEWVTELTELQKSGCDFSDIDLRQTFLNAVSTNKLIHQQALQYNTTSVYLLLAYLRDWVIQEEESVIAQRNKKAVLTNTVADHNDPTHPKPRASPRAGGGGAAEQHGAKSMVLMTQSQFHDLQTGQGQRQTRPLPSHLKACDNNKALCKGCNNTWDRSRSIPCFKGCKFVEHPEYNKDWRDKEPKTAPLTWRRFREKHPQITPPPSFLRWEEREKNFRANSSRPSSPSHLPNKHPRDD
jgi:hypothetical protein